MAEMVGGNVRARCPSCAGAVSTFEYRAAQMEYGGVRGSTPKQTDFGAFTGPGVDEYRLTRCAGCGRGGLAHFAIDPNVPFPNPARMVLVNFYPEAAQRAQLPDDVPKGIVAEFREAERCMGADCLRAAAGMFRSVLDKTLRANGYKVKKGTPLEQQIDLAAGDGVITKARQRRAHDEIRVLGNDVLHDDWQPIAREDVEAAQHYAQRILEDFYDDRPSTLALLQACSRLPKDGEQEPDGGANGSE